MKESEVCRVEGRHMGQESHLQDTVVRAPYEEMAPGVYSSDSAVCTVPWFGYCPLRGAWGSFSVKA